MTSIEEWQAVDPSYRGLYGYWERDNAECIELGLEISDTPRMIQAVFAGFCFLQVLYMATRAPRVTWEAIYLPIVETILYAMAASGNGALRMGNGKLLPFSRMASWLVTCPIMLFMVCGIHKETTIRGMEVRNMVMVAALLRVVCGMTASVSATPEMKWTFFGFGATCLCFEYYVVGKVFAGGIAKFSEIDTPRNRLVANRIRMLRGVFYFSWTAFPAVWVLAPTGLCLINEDVVAVAYLVADAICKNGNGIIQTHTLFSVLNGQWVPETIAEGARPAVDHSSETYFNQWLRSLCGFRANSVGSEPGSDGSSAEMTPTATAVPARGGETKTAWGGTEEEAMEEGGKARVIQVGQEVSASEFTGAGGSGADGGGSTVQFFTVVPAHVER